MQWGNQRPESNYRLQLIELNKLDDFVFPLASSSRQPDAKAHWNDYYTVSGFEPFLPE
jgi:hypothetical protein